MARRGFPPTLQWLLSVWATPTRPRFSVPSVHKLYAWRHQTGVPYALRQLFKGIKPWLRLQAKSLETSLLPSLPLGDPLKAAPAAPGNKVDTSNHPAQPQPGRDVENLHELRKSLEHAHHHCRFAFVPVANSLIALPPYSTTCLAITPRSVNPFTKNCTASATSSSPMIRTRIRIPVSPITRRTRSALASTQ